MWQRSQTIFMMLSVVLTIVLTFVSFGYFEWSENLVCVKATGVEGLEGGESPSTLLFLIPIVLAVLITVFAMSQFKNRPLQIKLLMLAMILQPVIIGLGYFTLNSVGEMLATHSPEMGWGTGMIFPVVNLILLFLARNAVRKDEELIKSVDRLR